MKRYQQTKQALGSMVQLTLVSKSEPIELFENLWQLITDFETKFSRFKENSELSLVNRSAGQAMIVSQQFMELVKCSIEMSKMTNNLFNPFILPALQHEGYVGSWPKPAEFNKALDYSSRTYEHSAADIKLDNNKLTIPLNSALDFGGIGKGYLLDKLAEYLAKTSTDNYWLSLGGDLLCQGFDINSTPWQINVQSLQKNQNIPAIINKTGHKLAIATSGTAKRKGLKNGQTWNHIIDPRTGRSVESDILAATVVSTSGTLADIYAKSVVLLGRDKSASFIKKPDIYQVIIQPLSGKISIINKEKSHAV